MCVYIYIHYINFLLVIFPALHTTPTRGRLKAVYLVNQPVITFEEDSFPMAEDINQIFQNANSKFNEQSFEQAEKLYTQFITSCLHSRYFCTFRLFVESSVTFVVI